MPVTGHRIVVVGGAGLIGSAVARALADADHGLDVVVCDRLGPAQDGKWRALPARLDDLWQPDELLARLEASWRSVAAVVVMADAGAAQADADALFASLFHLRRRLHDFASARQRPLVWASSLQVYGAGPAQPDAGAEALAALQPLTAFGRACLAFDLFAALHRQAADAPPVLAGLRFGSVYGAHEQHKGAAASLPVRALAAVRAGEPVALWRSTDPAVVDGGHTRDWIHADDAGALAASLIRTGASGFFDIGSGSAVSAHDVVRAAARAAGREGRMVFAEPPPEAALVVPAADLTALRAAGVEPLARSLDEGLAAL